MLHFVKEKPCYFFTMIFHFCADYLAVFIWHDNSSDFLIENSNIIQESLEHIKWPAAYCPAHSRHHLHVHRPKKRRRMADKILPWKVRDLVPESQAYMDLLAFERKLDATIMRKRLDIQVSHS